MTNIPGTLKKVMYKPLLILMVFLSACADDAGTASKPEPVLQGSERIIEALYHSSEDYVMVASHRGDHQSAPENSLPAIQRCIEMGVDIVEIDVRLTKDGHLVLMHDETIDRTTNGSGQVKFLSLSSLKTVRLKDSRGNVTEHSIPTLEEALTLAKGKILFLLDKADYLMPQVYAALQKTGTRRQVIFLGFSRADEIQAQYGALLDSILYMPSLHKSTVDMPAFIDEFSKALNPPAFAFWFDRTDSPVLPWMQAVRQDQRRAWVNTTDTNQCAGHTDQLSLNNPDEGWGWVIAKGANIILTDRPAQLLTYLRSKGKRK